LASHCVRNSVLASQLLTYVNVSTAKNKTKFPDKIPQIIPLGQNPPPNAVGKNPPDKMPSSNTDEQLTTLECDSNIEVVGWLSLPQVNRLITYLVKG